MAGSPFKMLSIRSFSKAGGSEGSAGSGVISTICGSGRSSQLGRSDLLSFSYVFIMLEKL